MPQPLPHKTEDSLMHDLARYIERHSDEPLTLQALADQAHLSPSHMQRRFKSAIGVSPKEYQDSCRLRKFKAGLQQQQSVTQTLYEVGFGSASRVYEKIDTTLGMTPNQYRGGGKHVDISYASGITPLGPVMIGATDRGICFLQFGESNPALLHQLQQEYPAAALTPMHTTHRAQFHAWMQSLNEYLRGNLTALELPLDIRGTAFQRKVWNYLQTIPSGQTLSYRDVAAAIGQPKAIRAVASACAKNTVAIAIPCHRVIRGNGDLAGYRWGVERKRHLLQLETRNA